MTYTCADIKLISAIMRHFLCISFFPSLLFWISHSRPQLPAIMISRSSSLPLPRLTVCLGVFFYFRYNGPKWKWKSAVLQSVSQLAKSSFKENHRQRFWRSGGFFFYNINPRGRYLEFLCIFCTHFDRKVSDECVSQICTCRNMGMNEFHGAVLKFSTSDWN